MGCHVAENLVSNDRKTEIKKSVKNNSWQDFSIIKYLFCFL